MARGRMMTTTIVAAACGLVVFALVLASIFGKSAHAEKRDVIPGQEQPGQAPVKKEEHPKVDVVFALDTTGSMGGLIEGAKAKIWALAGNIVDARPRPDLRIGLIGYRDLGDEYVTRFHPMMENMDDVYIHLQAFRARGGGDTAEHVNQALARGLREMNWRKGDDVLRILFLVGDAPPHNDYQDGLNSTDLAKEALQRNILINTIRCGSAFSTEISWKEIAQLAGGEYTSIAQDGGMEALTTPYDKELRRLNEELSTTSLSYGTTEEKKAAHRRIEGNRSMPTAAQAASARYRAISDKMDSNDLVDYVQRGGDLERLDDRVLPSGMVKMNQKERKRYVKDLRDKRARLQGEILKVVQKRDTYVKQQKKAQKGFDFEATKILQEQGEAFGLAY